MVEFVGTHLHDAAFSKFISVDEHCVAICEEGNTRVQIFIEDESAYCINNLQNPCGIALSHENIFVTDIDTNVVKVYGRNALEKVEMGKLIIS